LFAVDRCLSRLLAAASLLTAASSSASKEICQKLRVNLTFSVLQTEY